MDTLTAHAIVVQNVPAFLLRMMVALAGGSSMSLEGDLYDCEFPEGVHSGSEETGLLKRISRPRHRFMVLRLEPKFIETLFASIGDAKIMAKIFHLQIERRGILELTAYDRFEYTTSGPGVSAALLQQLKDAKIIREFRPTRSMH